MAEHQLPKLVTGVRFPSPALPATASLSIIIVAFNSSSDLERTLPAVVSELRSGDELIVVDNASEDGTPQIVSEVAPDARLIALSQNVGFAAAVNAGAAGATGNLLIVLNPDARPLPGFGEAIRRPLLANHGWSAWMSLVACEHGRFVNTLGNAVHFTGIAWAGGHGQPLPVGLEPHEVTAASGACLAVRAPAWREVGGFPEDFFLYHEDIDLSLRLRLFGMRVGLEPSAVVDHDYEFGARPQKWRWLERNRWAVLIRVFPAPLLALIAPALVLTELALIPVAIAGGWGRQKLAAAGDVIRWLPRLLAERRDIQSRRKISTVAFARWLTPDLDSPFIGNFARSAPIRGGLRAYWKAVLFVLNRLDP